MDYKKIEDAGSIKYEIKAFYMSSIDGDKKYSELVIEALKTKFRIVPIPLIRKIKEEKDEQILKAALVSAIASESLDEFESTL